MLPVQNFADTSVIVLRIFFPWCFWLPLPISWAFLYQQVKIVSETHTKTDFCHFSCTQLWSAVLSENSPLLNIKLETAQVNEIEIEQKKSVLSILIFAHLYAHNAIVSTVSVYASLKHVKVGEYENYKDYENKCFSLHPPLWNIIIYLPLEIA